MASGKRESTTAAASRLAEPILRRMGLELWDLRFEKEGSLWYLRYFIDKEGGVTIDDCEAFSRAIDAELDAADPIDQSYVLEVSSPGVERELTRDWHFARSMGQEVAVRLIRPVEGVRDFVGILTGYEGGRVTLRLSEEAEMTFERGEASRIRIYNDYSREDFGADGEPDDDGGE